MRDGDEGSLLTLASSNLRPVDWKTRRIFSTRFTPLGVMMSCESRSVKRPEAGYSKTLTAKCANSCSLRSTSTRGSKERSGSRSATDSMPVWLS